MQGELGKLRERFDQYKQCAEPARSTQLADLMTEMEVEFNIPMFWNAKYKAKNPEVMQLYIEVANARNFD